MPNAATAGNLEPAQLSLADLPPQESQHQLRPGASQPTDLHHRLSSSPTPTNGEGGEPSERLSPRVPRKRLCRERNSSPAGAAATAWCRAEKECGPGRGATP